MKTIKPLRLSVLHRTFESQNRCLFVATVYVYFPLDAPGVPLQEAHMWRLVAAELGDEAPLDDGMPKPGGEVLVHGYAFPRSDEPEPACEVRVQLGAVDKRLYAIGDRYWDGSKASEPVPFRQMALSWKNAFGGPGFAPNPLGKGHSPVVDPETGRESHPLPNIEWPKRLIAAPSDRPEPAGLGPIDLSWPQRLKKAGTYGQAWLDTRFPGLPDDIDWTFFHAAAEDQWLPDFFEGGEPLRLEGLHPERPIIESRLPTLRARCFVTRTGDEPGVLDEVTMRLETVQLFPHRERGILVFRGTTEVREDDASDIRQLLVACEQLGAPRGLSHYTTVLERRLDPKRGALHALRDSELMPERDPTAAPYPEELLGAGAEEELRASEGLLQKNMRQGAQEQLEHARERLVALGVDPNEHMPAELPPAEVPPDPEQLADYVDAQLEQAAIARAASEKERTEALERARARCAEHGIDLDEVLAKQTSEQGGPPTFNAKEQYATLLEKAKLAHNAGVAIPQFDKLLADPGLKQKLEQTERMLKDAYRRFAQHFPAASRLAGDEASRLKAEVSRAVAAGESLAGRDLTGADLGGLDLHGANLQGAFLEAADLTGADLRGADLTDAVLARADLTDARLSGARARGASFGAARLRRTDLSGGVDCTGATFAQATLDETDLSSAILDNASFLDATFSNTNLSGIRGSRITFLNSDLSPISMAGVRLTGARLRSCNLLHVCLDDVDLSGCDLEESVLLEVHAERAKLDDASCSRLRVVQGSSLAGASFQRARLEQANLRGTNLVGCDFSEANLAGADLSEADLQGASFRGANAPNALLIRANLRDADLSRANLMESLLPKATIAGANFAEANLFRVDFAKVRVDGRTKLAGANTKFIRFVKRPDEEGPTDG